MSGGNFETVNEPRDDRVDETLKGAIQRMTDAGFDIGRPVSLAIDSKLPFMGYTMPRDGGFTIVVSGMAVDSGMLDGLLLHELSHIYRMQTNHPSHNAHLLREAMRSLGNHALSHEYKRRIIRDLVNDLQDLYADEIAVKVMTQTQVVSERELTGFFQSWVKDAPVQSNDARRDRWLNLSIMEKNARAISQMRKQGIRDTGERAARSNERFLELLPTEMSKYYEYFEGLLSNLAENIGEDAYRVFLTDYLSKFVKVAEGNEE
jgi:hypothetical protein